MENNKKRNIIIIILVVLGIVLISLGIYFVFIKNDSKPISNNDREKCNIDTNEREDNEYKGEIYKTQDGKFTLKIVDKSDEKAKKDLEESIRDDLDDDDPRKESYVLEDDLDFYNDIKYYAYFNDIIMYVLDIEKEDDSYITYSFGGYKAAESDGYSLLVNKKNNTLEINPEELVGKENSCMQEGFCGFSQHTSFVKSDLGYFYIHLDCGDGSSELYTTSWKKLGYVYTEYLENNDFRLKEVDINGVTVYNDKVEKDCSGNCCSWNLLNPIKYDIDGNVVE